MSELQGLPGWVDGDSDGNRQERQAGEMASAYLGTQVGTSSVRRRRSPHLTSPHLTLNSPAFVYRTAEGTVHNISHISNADLIRQNEIHDIPGSSFPRGRCTPLDLSVHTARLCYHAAMLPVPNSGCRRKCKGNSPLLALHIESRSTVEGTTNVRRLLPYPLST